MEECYGLRLPFRKACAPCVQKFRSTNTQRTLVPVMGSTIHVFAFHKRFVQPTLDELTSFFQKTPNTIYASQPSYHKSKIPAQYKNTTNGVESVYWQLFSRAKGLRVHLLDYFQLTHSCYFENCTSDGGHRARYVNRWKAQLLLNTLCEYHHR